MAVFFCLKGLQVLRVAQVKTEHRKDEPSKTTCREICRYYINGKGQCEVIGLKRTMGPYLDCFSYNEGMALRYDNDTYSHLATFPLYPKMDVIPELERRSAHEEPLGKHRANIGQSLRCSSAI